MLLAILVASSLESCYSTTMIPKNTASVKTTQHKTIWTFFWGAAENKKLNNTDRCDCMGNGFSKVVIKNHLGFMLLELITLGIVEGKYIEWECAKDNNNNNGNL